MGWSMSSAASARLWSARIWSWRSPGRSPVKSIRILTVADVYDALRQRRVYKPSMTIEQSFSILRDEASPQHLDGHIVDLLTECLDEVEAPCGPLRPEYEDEPRAQQPTASS